MLSDFLVNFGSNFLKLYCLSFRYHFVNKDREDRLLDSGKPIIYSIFHGHLLPLAFLYRNKGIVTIVSQSKDGEIAARFLKKLGYEIVRGSSSKGGVRALIGAKKFIDKGFSAAITVDGPKGPRFEVKPGIIYLAKKTTGYVLPVVCRVNRCKEFNSWDKFILPYPFAKVDIIYGEPIYFSKSLNDSLVEQDRFFLQKRMMELVGESS